MPASFFISDLCLAENFTRPVATWVFYQVP